jgi:hypothetical protein
MGNYSDIQRKIEKFFRNILGIPNLRSCIDDRIYKVEVGNSIKEGITFKPHYLKLRGLIRNSNKFYQDNPSNFWGRMALTATKSEGFKEGYRSGSRPGWPSAHINLAPNKCNIHIDEEGFVSLHSGHYNFNAPRHINDELLFSYIPGAIGKHHNLRWISPGKYPDNALGNVGLEFGLVWHNSDLSGRFDLCAGASFLQLGMGRHSVPSITWHPAVGLRIGYRLEFW